MSIFRPHMVTFSDILPGLGWAEVRELGPSTRLAPVVVSAQRIRELALALPEAIEADHHGRPSFRVRGKIFATLWDEGHVNVMLDEPGILTAVGDHPGACRELWWGKRLSAVQVSLADADEAIATDLLADAWERRAPARLRGKRAGWR